MPKVKNKDQDQIEISPGQTTIDEQIAEANGSPTRGSLLNAAYTKAGARLREAHREEFDTYLREEYAARGVAHRRRLSKEEREAQEAAVKMEKAKDALAKILKEFPELAVAVKTEELTTVG